MSSADNSDTSVPSDEDSNTHAVSDQKQISPISQHGSESTVTSTVIHYGGSVKSIPFDGTNFLDWQFKMQCELLSFDLLHHVVSETFNTTLGSKENPTKYF